MGSWLRKDTSFVTDVSQPPQEVENKVAELGNKSLYDQNFIYDLLAAYGKSSSSISRLKTGSYNVAMDKATEVAWKNSVFFKYIPDEDLHHAIDTRRSDQLVVRYSLRFVIVTDFVKLLAIDTKTNETLDIPLKDIHKHYTFFLPWAGMEKSLFKAEQHADRKAAEKMAKLFDEIVKENPSPDPKFYHGLNVFFSRLLFCFFAEDTTIFEKGQFTNAIDSHTQHDGSDLARYLDELFVALDVKDKTAYPAHISAFPYVNGGLFSTRYTTPQFNTTARRLIIECGSLDWSEINPDIFGSMIQAVVNTDQRATLGMHYTSVPNIMKTIEPLFLDDLKEALNDNFDDKSKLEKLLKRIYRIRVFDPACGSGNFLIIAYKELRRLEHAILERIYELTTGGINRQFWSGVDLNNFYGIDIDDFNCEVAVLSLWLAKHQMNLEFEQKFGIAISLIPLKETGNIVKGNATRLAWSKVCPNDEKFETYLIGNPPYAGSSLQEEDQKADMEIVFTGLSGYKNLDYISCWFKKGADYISDTNAQLAFVSTNSICQGEQVAILWPYLLEKSEIGFAYQSFKWANNAKGNAGVTCIIVSLRGSSNALKYIFIDSIKQTVNNINPYLTAGSSTIISKRSKPIAALPAMSYGSKPVDGGSLILSTPEKDRLIADHPEAIKYVKKFIGADELLSGKERWCLWIMDADAEEASRIGPIRHRIENVFKMRHGSKKTATRESAKQPYKFGEVRYKEAESIIIPAHTSEGRDYLPIDHLDKDTVVSNSSHVLLGSEPYVFALISSHLHMLWIQAVAGRIKTDIRYSSALVYNNFPVPDLTETQKDELEEKALAILDARENHSEKTLADMYDPDKMPDDLLGAHQELDAAVEALYRKKPFASDEEKIAFLFAMYEDMTTKQKVIA